jgi:hypothetical protein
MTSLFGDSFTILSTPGWPKVDYLRIEQLPRGITRGASLEGGRYSPTDPKTSIHADNARFSAYATMIGEETASHMTIFHLSRNARSNSLGPWISRAGVGETLQSDPVCMDSRANALAVLNSVLRPELGIWTADYPILNRHESGEAVHSLVRT